MTKIEVPDAVRSLRAVDFGVGLPPALVTKFLADIGVRVDRIEPVTGDPFYEVYPAYRLWRKRARLQPVSMTGELLRDADICVVGGEDYPGLARGPEADELLRKNPRLIVLRISGYPSGPDSDRPAVDLLVQARTGVVWEQYSDRPVHAGWPLSGHGAALQGLIGLWVALVDRARGGPGQVVDVSMAAGTAMFWSPFWMDVERPDKDFINLTPRDTRQLILRCKDGGFIHITLGVQGALQKLHQALGIPGAVDPNDRGLPDGRRGPENFYGDLDLFNRYAANYLCKDLIENLRGMGIPAEEVREPGGCWSDSQVLNNGIIEGDCSGWKHVGMPLGFFPSAGIKVVAPDRLQVRREGVPPLAGIRVLDLGIFVAGPYVSKILADYGADVIRVDAPTGGLTLSGTRTVIAANYGKRSTFLDLKSDDGRRLLRQLCEDADVAVSNFRPGVAKRLGFDPASLREANPSLLTLEVTGYGHEGPDAGRPGFDMVIQARSGLEQRAGGAGNAPMCSRTPVTDFATGAIGAIGVLVALYERVGTGRVVDIRTNLLDVGIHMLSEVIESPQGEWSGAEATDLKQSGFHPAESIYPCTDGWVAIAARSDGMAASLAAAVAADFPATRAIWGEEERQMIASRLSTWPVSRALTELGAAGVWVEECRLEPWKTVTPDGLIFKRLEDGRYGEVVHCLDALVAFSHARTNAGQRLQVPVGGDTDDVMSRGWRE